MYKPRPIMDSQLGKLPQEVKFCKKCVVSNQRPRIAFDENGVCNACHYAEFKKTIDWAERKKQFLELVNKYRSNDGSYDVIVPCSGGKDSSMIAHRLKYEYGMHPLCFTYSPPLYSQIGWQNLRRFIDAGFDHYLITPNGKLNRALTKLGFILQGDHNEIFDYAVAALPFKLALRHNVKIVMFAENGEAEYGGTNKDWYSPGRKWEDFQECYFSSTLDDMVRIGKEDGYITEPIENKTLDMFTRPSAEELDKAGVQMHWFGYYHHWTPQENYYYAAENTGFQANPEGRTIGTYSKYAQIDDATDSFIYYMMFIKFGIGRTTSDAAHEIRDGHITREEGVALVHRYDGEFPQKDLKTFIDYIDLTEDEFYEVVDRFRLPHIWKKEHGVWKLMKQVA
jgi:N-acetyl sugar amidotransferase